MEIIAFDSHKRYTQSLVEDARGRVIAEDRITHEQGAIWQYLKRFKPGCSVAVETIGNWYWIVEEIEQAGMKALLVHARKAKVMVGNVNKTDRLDVRGLNRLQRTGTLPTVWIPPGELRDKRDIARTRMFLVSQRTQLKNRIHATLDKYALEVKEVADIFGVRGRQLLEERCKSLPPHTRFTVEQQLTQVDGLEGAIDALEKRMSEVFAETEEVRLLRTIPGIGFLLAVVISLEVGDVSRFGRAEQLASYAGTTPRVHASGGKLRYGRLRTDVNHYLKWAYVEAANAICLNRSRWPKRHVCCLYERLRSKKGHAVAIGAVARHLAEATYWVLTKKEQYQDPQSSRRSSTEA